MSLVIDASVATKWVLDEDGSDRANALRDEPDLIAPSLIAAEVGSALWKAVRRRSLPKAEALAAVSAILRPFERLIPNEELHGRALDIAIALDHAIYDCFYLALAERERSPLVTADARLVTTAKRTKGIEVRPL